MIDLSAPDLEQTFYNEVEQIVQQSNSLYMEAVIHWCQSRSIEVEYVTSYINKNLNLKSKIQIEAEDLNYLKRIKRLPI